MFWLNKWYFDCTTPDGRAVIAYWARGRWAGLRVRYAAVLIADHASGSRHERSTVRAGEGPLLERTTGGPRPTGIEFRCRALGLVGRWEVSEPAGSAPEQTLLATGRGDVRWWCAVPRGECTVRVGTVEFRGWGYVERLEMSLPPWSLPVREIRWGRWLGERSGLVWIDWRGPSPLTLVLRDGQPVEGRVSDERVEAGGDRLTWSATATLREGELGVGPLAAVPVIRSALPSAMLRTHERKWLARGILTPSSDQGWVIAERVVLGE